MRLFSNRSQMTSKCGKNISDTLGCASCATFLFLPHFDVICNLLLNRRMATWNLLVNKTYVNTESICEVTDSQTATSPVSNKCPLSQGGHYGEGFKRGMERIWEGKVWDYAKMRSKTVVTSCKELNKSFKICKQ